MPQDARSPDQAFPGTQWTEIASAAKPATPQGQVALGAVLDRYRTALIAHLRAKFSVSPEDAEDLLHGFIEKKVLQSGFMAGAEPSRGRFRTYLLSSLDRFAISELRRQRARKRTPGSELLPLDSIGDDFLADANPAADALFEEVWSSVAIAGALLNMRNDCERQGREVVWSVFNQRVVAPTMADTLPISYDELRRRHGLTSPSSAFNLLATGKRMFKRHLRQVVAEYSQTNEELEQELAYLNRYLFPNDE